jgi:enoyl-CoA hydratase/3-hydroxyacyl-CoA dehydrogenase
MTAVAYRNPLLTSPRRPLPQRLAVIGAGTIGPDIAYYLKSALPASELLLVDIEQRAIDAALRRLREYAHKAVTRGRMSAADAAAIEGGVSGTRDYGAVAGCNWVLEAASENLALKRRIFATVEEIVAPDALITSNTSSLPAARLFAELRHPERATVTHFFAPAWRNPVVEVIRWSGLDPALLAYLRWVFCATGKVPLQTADVVCFMLDRIFDNWCNEAAHCLQWATAAEVDSVAGELVSAGPFFVLNMAHGNPIITEANNLQADEEGEHYRPAPIFRSVDNWLTAPAGTMAPVAPEMARKVRDRLLGVLLSQSLDIVDREIGAAEDLELGCRLALAFRRGPLGWLQRLGTPEASRILERFAHERPGMPLPRRSLADYPRVYRHILVDEFAGVCVLTLRRPEALNALHDEMTDELLAVIRERESDPRVPGFVIIGYGTRAFCAGADIERFPPLLGRSEAAAQYARDCSRLLVHLDAMRKPVVAALNGMALGGGLELAMRCHGIVAVPEAWMQFPEVTLGIAPGIGALVVPYRRWPGAADVFHGMLRRAERLAAVRAHELGIVDALADDYASLAQLACQRVRALAGRARAALDRPVPLATLPDIEPRAADGQDLSAEVVAIIGRAIDAAAQATSLGAALEVGYRAFGATACTAAAREGISAFQERRRPDYSRTG